MNDTAASFAPVAAATGEAVKLAMQRLWLGGRVLPAGARLTVQHVFRSEETDALEVIYAFPLPRDAALRRFRISGEGFEAHSELRPTAQAIAAYESGVLDGSLSALARVYGDGIVNLTVGNIRPGEMVTVHLEIIAGVELRDDGFRFRFPFTLAPGFHSRARSAVVQPGEGEMELPAEEFGDVILPPFRRDASALHQAGFELSVITELEVHEIGSPSHTVRVTRDGARASRVALCAESDLPDRDLVLDARFADIAPQVLAGRDHFAAIVPSTSFGARPEAARRLVILLDRSGSMQGAPMKQATRAVEACLGALSERDLFGICAFDDRVETFHPRLLEGSSANRAKAREFLGRVQARGGTELAQGFRAAARLLDGGGDVFILTDGQVMGTESILADARAASTRLHCLGIGSASQDRFLALLARETGGISRFVTARERVDISAVDLFASIGLPVVSGLKAAGRIAPEPPATIFSGAPVLLFGEAAGEAERRIELSWNGGRLSLPVDAGDEVVEETVRLLQGARLITDWESRYPADEAHGALEKRRQSRVAGRLRELSEAYGLASREMSLVAVVKRGGDRPGQLPLTRIIPIGMPQDTSFDVYFAVRRTAGAGEFSMAFASPPLQAYAAPMEPLMASAAAPPPEPVDLLVELAARMEPDGGMRGRDLESRAGASIAALFAFLTHGHTSRAGAFRSHVGRLEAFLRSAAGLPPHLQRLVDAALAAGDRAPVGDWTGLAYIGADPWPAIEQALRSSIS
jgi:Ca-activated chloride channel family protein